MSEVYLDHAATAPVRPEVVEAVAEAMLEVGNPASLHRAGRVARRRLEEARERVASALGADPVEVVFTGGGTEADNLAVKGLWWARTERRPELTGIVTGPTEHHAVLDAVLWLGRRYGATISWAEPDGDGRVGAAEVADAVDRLGGDAAVVSVMWANNEIGAVSPVAEIAAATAKYDVPLHTDAVQAVGAVPVDFSASGADALSLSAHKFGGPRGVGALLVRRSATLTPLLHGGGQERDLRSGTADLASVVGMAVALDLAVAAQEQEWVRLAALRARLADTLLAAVPDLQVNGVVAPAPATALPGLLSLSVPGCAGDALLMVLDERGFRVSTGAACTSGVPEPSHVVLAVSGDADRASSTLRISLGRTSTEADVAALVSAFPSAVALARAAST